MKIVQINKNEKRRYQKSRVSLAETVKIHSMNNLTFSIIHHGKKSAIKYLLMDILQLLCFQLEVAQFFGFTSIFINDILYLSRVTRREMKCIFEDVLLKGEVELMGTRAKGV